MHIGFGRSRILWYIAIGTGIGLILFGIHTLLEIYEVPYHNMTVFIIVPIIAIGMALLAYRENAIYHWGERMDSARRRVNDLMIDAVKSVNIPTDLEDEGLATCWRTLDCDYEECPVYGRETARCWLIAGTFCRGEVQGKFAKKLQDCRLCEVYQQATDDPVKEIDENFRAMSYLLNERQEELEVAYEKSRQRGEKLEGLVALSELAISTLQQSDMLKELLESTASFAGADVGLVLLVDSTRENLNVRAFYGLEPGHAARLKSRVGEGFIGQAFLADGIEVQDVNRVESEDLGALSEQQVKTLITIPLQGRDEHHGVLLLATLVSHNFTEEEKNALIVAAGRISTVIDSYQLERQLDRDHEITELVGGLTDTLDSEKGIGGVYDSFVRMASRLLDFDRASLAIWHPESNEIELAAMDTDAPRTWLGTGLRLPTDALPIGEVISGKRYLVRGDIKGDSYPADKLLVEEGIRSEAIFPLMHRGEVLGALTLGSFNVHAFSGKDVEVIEPLTRQLGAFLDSARAFEQAQYQSLIENDSGLYNHSYFLDAARHEVTRSRLSGKPVSLAIFEISGFNQLEEDPAAEAGNMIRRVADRIRGTSREVDIVARQSSSEIALLMPELSVSQVGGNGEAALSAARRTGEAIRDELASSGNNMSREVYIGLAEYPATAADASELIEQAETAAQTAHANNDHLAVAGAGA